MNGWLGKTCSYRKVDQLNDDQYAQLTAQVLPEFGCNVSLFQEVYGAYEYLRDAPPPSEVCRDHGRPNFTFALPHFLHRRLGCRTS